MKSIQRLPFRLATLIWSSEWCQLAIAKAGTEGFHLQDSFIFDLPMEIAEFICSHGVCALCGSNFKYGIQHCLCEKFINEDLVLIARFPTEKYTLILQPMLKREQARIKNLKRKERISAIGGVHSSIDVAIMYRIQEGICYYCGKEISAQKNDRSFHIDHYEAVSDGGSNGVENIVLACASCNLKKGSIHGDDFESIAKKNRPSEIGRRLGKIRRSLNRYRATKRQMK